MLQSKKTTWALGVVTDDVRGNTNLEASSMSEMTSKLIQIHEWEAFCLFRHGTVSYEGTHLKNYSFANKKVSSN